MGQGYDVIILCSTKILINPTCLGFTVVSGDENFDTLSEHEEGILP